MTDPVAPGPLALVGSGEFSPAMTEIDRGLLAGRAARVVIIPTAAGQEGSASVERWIGLGQRHAERLGVEPVPVPVLDRHDAARPDLVERIAGGGLIYFSGGDPGHLAATFAGTPALDAVLDAWAAGSALAGCSAGAMAQGTRTLAPRAGGTRPGFDTVPGLLVLPHYDRYRMMRGRAAAALAELDESTVPVGIDEDTALVWHPGHGWRVDGAGAAHLLDDRAEPITSAVAGEMLPLGCTPRRPEAPSNEG